MIVTGTLMLAVLANAAAEPASRPARPPSVEQRVAELLDRAVMADDPAAGLALVDEAATMRRRARRTGDPLEWGFIETDILRTRGRVLLMAWQRDETRTADRDTARDLLTQAAERYPELREQAQNQAAEIQERLGQADPTRNERYRAAKGFASRANYALAWTHYHLALTVSGPQRKAHLDRAVERFTPFTGNGYQDHPVVMDCFLGLALSYHELNRHVEITELLAPAGPGNTPPAIFKRMTFLRLQAYRAQVRHRELDEAAREYFGGIPDSQALDTIELGMAVDWAASLAALAGDPDSNPYYQHYQKQLDDVARRVYAYGEPWRSDLIQAIGRADWAALFAARQTAQEHFRARRYHEAIKAAQQGLTLAKKQAKTEQDRLHDHLLAGLRYLMAAAAWNAGDWAAAHESAAAFLREHTDHERLDEVCSLALQAGLMAMDSASGTERQAFETFMNSVETKFPRNAEVAKLPWYRGSLLLRTGQFARARSRFGEIPPDSPVYPRARYGLALAAFKQAEALADPPASRPTATRPVNEERAALLREALESLHRYAEALSPDPPAADPDTRHAAARLTLAALEQLLDEPDVDLGRIRGGLKLAARLAEPQGQADEVRGRRLALSIGIELREGRFEQAMRSLDDLLRVGASAGLPALARVAEALEKQHDRLLNDGEIAAAGRLNERLIAVYEALWRNMQATPDAPDTEHQSIAIRRHLARALQRAGRHREAIVHYDWLVEHVPAGKAGAELRGLAVSHEAQGDFDEAIEIWRRLAKGLKRDTAEWYEAKLGLIRCHHQAGRTEHARDLLAYFRLQCPRVKDAVWQERFASLGRELEMSSP